uniref:Uncharacterized protein n=1 Tax=Anguilla anguilla TaxID=7936 RepID=A0A0E9QWJ4_ANGAN
MVYSSERFESSLCAMLSWPTVIRKTSLEKGGRMFCSSLSKGDVSQ